MKPTPAPWKYELTDPINEEWGGEEHMIYVGSDRKFYDERHLVAQTNYDTLNRKPEDPTFRTSEADSRLIVGACNSYQKHFSDPVAAAEGDLLGEALKVIQLLQEAMRIGYASHCGPQDWTSEHCETLRLQMCEADKASIELLSKTISP